MLKFLLRLVNNELLEKEFLARFKEDFDIEALDSEANALVIKDLSKIEDIDGFLLTLLKADRLKYFNSVPESQSLIKGAFLRTLWLLKEIRKNRDLKEQKVVKKQKYT